MSIPKTIHYCWFGRNPKPKLAEKCIKSWKKYCPDYEIIEWNEDNFDIVSTPLYVRQAYEAKKWAFVTDYVRLKVVYDHGGIYLDTDVELIKPLDILLSYDAYFGFEDDKWIATGLGFGAIKGHQYLVALLQDYETVAFARDDGSYDTMPCPKRNTLTLQSLGLIQNGDKQEHNNNVFLSSEYLSPINYYTGVKNITSHTISIHHYAASWMSLEAKRKHKSDLLRQKAINLTHTILHLPNRIIKKILGVKLYTELKNRIKKD